MIRYRKKHREGEEMSYEKAYEELREAVWRYEKLQSEAQLQLITEVCDIEQRLIKSGWLSTEQGAE